LVPPPIPFSEQFLKYLFSESEETFSTKNYLFLQWRGSIMEVLHGTIDTEKRMFKYSTLNTENK